MKRSTVLVMGLLGAMTAGCMDTTATAVQRTSQTPIQYDIASGQQMVESFYISKASVDVPMSLKHTEKNTIYPRADIVWHGDPYGNRYEQVQAIFETAIIEAAAQVDGEIPVIAEIEVVQFHALTPRARYSVGGNHEIQYLLTLREEETGAVLMGPKLVDPTFEGFGGRSAVAAEREGLTQKKRINTHLVESFVNEFTMATSF